MVKLTDDYIKKAALFNEIGIELPQQVAQGTAVNWLHFGGGNLFRAFHMEIQQTLINQGVTENKVVLVETFDRELIEKVYQPYANRMLKVELSAQGDNRLTLLDSVKEAVFLGDQASYNRIKAYFIAKDLQIVTFSITEKGYQLKDQNDVFYPFIEKEFEQEPQHAHSTIGLLVSLLYDRFVTTSAPIALVSTDNFSHNGDKLKDSVLTMAEAWVAKGYLTLPFLAYLKNPEQVAFPWSMIDRITPNPSEIVKANLETLGLEDIEIIKTARQSTSAAFGNTEETHYLVIENDFPNGAPDLEKAGVILTNRETVDKIERMKVCTCLNPLHTSLALFGCLLGYDYIYEEMKDSDLVSLVQQIGYIEGLPVVVDPGVINPKEFLDEVVTKRFTNPYIPDTPQRIATDTSQKVAIRFGNTIKAYLEDPTLNHQDLVFISLTIAAWLRYLLGVDDQGKVYQVSPDPLLAEMSSVLASVKLGQTISDLSFLDPILANVTIFGVDLVEAQLATAIKANFAQMIQGPGKVRQVLQQHVLTYSERLECYRQGQGNA